MRSTRTHRGASMPRLRIFCREAAACGLAKGLFGWLGGGLAGGLAGVAVASLLVVVSPASGQSVTLHFDLDGDLFNTAEVAAGAEPVTWTVWASFTAPDPTAYFGGYVGDIVPAGDADGMVRNVYSLLGGQATAPRIDSLAIENINIFNWSPYSGPMLYNPLAIFSFEFLADPTQLPGHRTQLSYDTEGITSLFPDDNIFSLPTEFTEFAVISDVLVVPVPGASAALMLGVMASRRGRHSGQRTV